MVDVVKALVFLVEIATELVRVPVMATKMDVGMTPLPHRRWPNDLKQGVSGRPAHDS